MSYIVFGVGSPSDLPAFEKTYRSLGDKTINHYLDGKGIKHLEGPLKISCHRTLDRVISYAQELENYSKTSDERIIAILFGGLSFALPGIFSSQTSTIPIIGVPAYTETSGGGLDSATAVYNLPAGTVVGGAPPHSEYNTSLDKAVLIAEKILKMEINQAKLTFLTSENPKITKELFDGNFQQLFSRSYFKSEIFLSNLTDAKNLKSHDHQTYLSLQSKNPKTKSLTELIDTLSALKDTNNTLYFGELENAVLFLARALALNSDGLKKKLIEHHKQKTEETEKKYGPRIGIAELFKRGDNGWKPNS